MPTFFRFANAILLRLPPPISLRLPSRFSPLRFRFRQLMSFLSSWLIFFAFRFADYFILIIFADYAAVYAADLLLSSSLSSSPRLFAPCRHYAFADATPPDCRRRAIRIARAAAAPPHSAPFTPMAEYARAQYGTAAQRKDRYAVRAAARRYAAFAAPRHCFRREFHLLHIFFVFIICFFDFDFRRRFFIARSPFTIFATQRLRHAAISLDAAFHAILRLLAYYALFLSPFRYRCFPLPFSFSPSPLFRAAADFRLIILRC